MLDTEQGLPANGQIMPQGDERKLIVRFYNEAIKNATKSLQEGRPIFDSVPFIEILIPGDKNTRVNRKVRDEDKEKYPAAWQRFVTGTAPNAAAGGTPIEQWPALGVQEVAEFKAMNIYTVEQVAGLSDGMAGKYAGLATLRKMAQAYIKAATDSSEAQRLAVELEKRDEQIDALKNEVKLLAQRLDQALERGDGGSKLKAKAAA